MRIIYIYVIGEEYIPEAFDSLAEADSAAEKHGDQVVSGPWQVVVDDHGDKLLEVCREALAVGQVLKERLELNNLAGEENPFIEVAEKLIAISNDAIEELEASA